MQTKSAHIGQWSVVRFSLILTVLVSLIECWWLQGPFERDVSIYFVVARELLEGRWLYSDLWDHKPPAIHFVYALCQWVAGSSKFALWLLSVVTSVSTGIGLVIILRHQRIHNYLLLSAVCLWAILGVSPNLEATQPNTEAFINLCLVWSVCSTLLIHRFWLAALLSAVLFAFATLFKPITLVFILPLALRYLLNPKLTLLRRVSGLVALLFIPGIIWALTASYFLMTDRWAEFYGAVILYNRFYAGDIAQNLFSILSRRMFLRGGIGSLVIPVIGVALAFRGCRDSKILLISFTWIISILFAIALPGNLYLHYYQLALPWLIIGLSVGASALTPFQTRTLMTAVWVGLLVFELPLFIFPTQHPRSPFYASSPFVQARSLVPFLNQSVTGSEWFYQWGAEAELYASSGIHPKQGALHVGALMEGPLAQELSEKTLSILKRDPPKYIVISQKFIPQLNSENRVFAWIVENYKVARRISGAPDFFIVERPAL